MQSKLVFSFLSLVALAAGGLITGCDSDATIAKSGVGESCDSSADCEDNLNCIQGACYKGSTGTGGSDNQGGEGSGATSTGATAPVPVLGGEGESCTKRADCKDGLGCFNERCTKSAGGGEGGEGNGGPELGRSGETCGLTSDCGEGLACLPQGSDITIKAIGSNSVGVCTPIDSGIEATGKTCGHECIEAADCCQLPIPQQAATGAASCTELALLAADVPDCDIATGVNGLICLAYTVYCDEQCGKNTWACEAGQCSYTAKCTKAGQVVGGCPSYTRGAALANIPACNTKTSKCELPAGEVMGCKADADCDEGLVVADYTTDNCVEGECACQVETGKCYRKCAEDLDCPLEYTCDTEISLCVPEGSCTTDAYCVVTEGDIRATCVEGECSVPCEHDIDCNPGGLVNGYFAKVCSSDKTCVLLGCASNDECGPLENGVKSFCGTPVVGEGAPGTVVSAVTD